MSEAQRLRALKAITVRHHPERDTTDLDRMLAEERIAQHIRKVVAEAPPLTNAQKARLRALLSGGAPDAT